MGQAKSRQLRESAFSTALSAKVDLAALASAMRKLATAASASLGADCYLHAALPKVILAEGGIEASVALGFAAWRVGNGDSDVIVHAPLPGSIQHPSHSDALPFHVWLTVQDDGVPWILDFTTYQLSRKAAELDSMDGGTTRVDWNPDFLLIPVARTTSLREVTQGRAGLCHYAENAQVAHRVEERAVNVDPFDLESLRLICRNPDINVIGPNSSQYRSAA